VNMSADPEQDHFCAGHFDGASGAVEAVAPVFQVADQPRSADVVKIFSEIIRISA
jgi:hypothetical protein